MAQTSVEWLFDTLAKTPMTEWYEIREEAIKKHKEEITVVFNESWVIRTNARKPNFTGEQYYNLIFNK